MEIADMSHLCVDRANGELVPHPTDCQGFFACAVVPILHYCEEGLHFNADRALCDLPERANCQLGALTPAATDVSLQHNKPQPVFMAVDVASGLPVDPMQRYDPHHIECRHFGAYFLPHPRNCQLYFICAYGHLHRHQCGRGTQWNYKSSECQLSEEAECYSREWSNINDKGDNDEALEIGVSPTVASLPTTTSVNPVTVCYIVGSDSTTLSTSSTQYITSPLPTSPVEDHIKPTSRPADSTPRADENSLKCPSEKQSYLPHPEDCSKYYICIIGKPVLTTCPKGLFWDQKSGYCDLAKYVKCFQDA
ncbi:uncharacterized protein LOC115622270 [Scaptodrosophila lebanonensis]|uniref:Uncharacterized protein LOC115622270 n=1 Tax=Drosophila lebanonensis TaxID=7225 RepID=A0A6J2TAP6_DROLE|nr:uncharacterized protein LOC115622270 [Scaptodrosophila lebanonensis]